MANINSVVRREVVGIRLYNICLLYGITTYEELFSIEEREFQTYKHVGIRTINTIRRLKSEIGSIDIPRESNINDVILNRLTELEAKIDKLLKAVNNG